MTLLPAEARLYVLLGGLAMAGVVILVHEWTVRELDEHARQLAARNERLRGMATRLGYSLKAVQDAYAETVEALSATVEAKDPYTAGHAARVADLAEATAEALGLGLYDRDLVRRAALLHDLGKIGVRDSVLGKQGALTDEEWSEVRHHPTVGARIVGVLRSMEPLAPVVLHHHERWDGTGYPDGLAGEDIPLGARILAVADSYDAMTSDRPYRTAMTPDEALGLVRRFSGSQFDAAVARAFEEVVDAATAGKAEQAERPCAREVDEVREAVRETVREAVLELDVEPVACKDAR